MGLFGVTQGRLSNLKNDNLDYFPVRAWKKEFRVAKEVGLDFIEVICDKECLSQNPINSPRGVELIREQIIDHDLNFVTFCDNHIINASIWDCKSSFDKVISIIESIKHLNFEYYILPLVGESNPLKSNSQNIKNKLKIISKVLKSTSVELLVESNLNASGTKDLIDFVNDQNINLLYDIGNQSYLGNSPEHDLWELREILRHIHIKDKNINGQNVKLGEGVVDYFKLSRILKKINYRGHFTLETSPGRQPMKRAVENLKFIKTILENK